MKAIKVALPNFAFNNNHNRNAMPRLTAPKLLRIPSLSYSGDSEMTFYMNPDSIFHVTQRSRSRSKSRRSPLPDFLKKAHSKIAAVEEWELFPKNVDEPYLSQKPAFAKSCRRILAYIGDNHFCASLNLAAVKRYMNACDFVATLNGANGAIAGFVAFNVHSSQNLEGMDIRAICSNPEDLSSGETIITHLDSFCEVLGLANITLRPTNSAIPFYHTMGFTCESKTCVKITGYAARNRRDSRKKRAVRLEATNIKFFVNPEYIATGEKGAEGREMYSRIAELMKGSKQGEIFPKNFDLAQNRADAAKRNAELMEYFTANDFCPEMHPRYVKKTINDSNLTVVVYGANGHIHGFAACDIEQNNKNLYISTICANPNDAGAGTMLIHSIKNVCKAVGINTIQLDSVPGVQPFYEKLRFVCDQGGNCEMNVNGPPGVDPDYSAKNPGVVL